MAGSRTLKLSILADVDNLKKELDKGSKEVEGFSGKLEKFSAAAKAAFLAAAAAAGAYAVKLAVDGVKAAIEDEAAQQRLANALKNVTDATDTQIASIEKQILKTSLATGVADDQLRPAFQRLAIATGDLTKSSDLLTLALDISAATGKDVETVSNALGKAYEGNTGALTRLGVGLSATEIKTLGLEGAITTLSDTFGGAAATQAETFEGRIERLKIRFEETKESVGTALLPIIEKLLKFITDDLIPGFEKFKKIAIDPVIKAIKDNKEVFETLYKFGKDTLLPFITGQLTNGVKGVATVASTIVKAVAIAVKALEPIINAAITGLNAIIRLKNALTGSNTPTLGKVDFSSSENTGSNTVPSASLPSGVTLTTPTITSLDSSVIGAPSSITAITPATSAPKVTAVTVPTGITGTSNFNVGSFRAVEERSMAGVVINVNGAIDPASTARQIVDLLNNEAAVSGSFSNLGLNRFATRAE